MRTLALAICLVGGCDALANEQDSRDLISKVQEVRARMHERFAASRRIESAIAFGDLDRAHAEADTIAMLEDPDVLVEWQPYLENVRHAAAQVVAAPDLASAARTSAVLGRRCAQCHEAAHAKIRFAATPAPENGPRLPAQMASHQWAMTQLWEGLVGPSPTRWRAGARTLSAARIAIVAEGDNLPPDVGAADDVQRLHLYARRAVDAKTLDDRAASYGEILVTCAGCHRTIRD